MTDKIYLQDILPLEKLNEEGTVILVRHYHEKLNEMIKLELIEEYQSYQRKNSAFRDCKLIISFLAEPNNHAKLFGVYRNLGIKENLNLPKYSKLLEKYCVPQNIDNDLFMELKKVHEFEKFENRIIIDWIVPRGWYNTYGQVKNKEVVKILPYNFVDEFPGLMRIKLSAQELKTIINNPQTHSKWYESLTRLQAVYMILDKKTGNQYIGTTYGQNGLWQRWENYAKGDFTGGNKELIDLKEKDNNFHDNFQYSILEVLSKNASQKECVDAESLWKEKLGTRTFGLNKN
ncbi:MAG: GIY-YIG nuclease family protein [Bacteroidales bacterium]|nr:GIY-YIG nuclease family protein [Bacteroidales bacterium]